MNNKLTAEMFTPKRSTSIVFNYDRDQFEIDIVELELKTTSAKIRFLHYQMHLDDKGVYDKNGKGYSAIGTYLNLPKKSRAQHVRNVITKDQNND